jgi:hypothetical protein
MSINAIRASVDTHNAPTIHGFFAVDAALAFFSGFFRQYTATSLPFLVLWPLTQVQAAFPPQAVSVSPLHGDDSAFATAIHITSPVVTTTNFNDILCINASPFGASYSFARQRLQCGADKSLMRIYSSRNKTIALFRR